MATIICFLMGICPYFCVKSNIIFQDDKLEKLFKMYAEKVKEDLEKLVFCFDGDKVSPTTTPEALGLEDDDMLEAHIKTH